MVNLKHNRCTAENKGRKSLSFHNSNALYQWSEALILQKHSRHLSTIQAFSVLLWHVAQLYNTLQQLLENQKTK